MALNYLASPREKKTTKKNSNEYNFSVLST